jgi:hypothetical protein
VKAFAAKAKDAAATPPFLVHEGTVGGVPFRIEVRLAAQFFKRARKEKALSTPWIGQALANVRYGYDPKNSESPGGADGIFNVGRKHKPANEMVRKLYDRFLDTEKGRAVVCAHGMDPDDVLGVRVVSHHLRLLGFLALDARGKRLLQKLLLVDLDVNRR